MNNKPLRIRRLELTDVGGFEQMVINFSEGLNLICGPNGVGKTTVLDAIGSIFVAHYALNVIRRRSGSKVGRIQYAISANGEETIRGGEVKNFNPDENLNPFGYDSTSASKVIYLRGNRELGYGLLSGVMRDPVEDSSGYQTQAVNGIAVHDIKQWFGNRYLMEPHGKTWPRYQLENLRLAKTFFSLLDPEVKLSHVDSSTFEIILNTRSGDIPFEYMSAGFRTSYALILGILKEIEFRKLGVSADNFDGIIMVDELDLHLHPTWHGPMLDALKASYPKAQLVVTTHSPHMVQCAKLKELIVLPREGMQPRHLTGVDPEFGLIGWTVEEILRDVMGMEDPRPPAFVKIMERYENAVTRQDHVEIQAAKSEVLRALHPSSIVRQIVEIEAI